MTCEQVRQEIHEALDRGTPGVLSEAFRAHLATCTACRELGDDLQSLSHAFRALPRVPLPAEVLDAVWRETLRARPAGLTTTQGFWRVAAAASLVAALGTATLYFVSAPAPPPGPTAVELARASAQAEMVFGYTARALAATRNATTDRLLASKISPAVRGEAASHPSRRPR
jgi:predicted anti-sigma-YlaC factor YlaD